MNKNHNSSELSKQIAEKMNLNQEDGLKLYKELAEIPNGQVKNILDILTRPEEKKTMSKYLACVRDDCVRDAQYCIHENGGDFQADEDSWLNARYKELVLETVEANSPTRAVQIAAAHAGVDEGVIKLYLLE